MKGGEAVRLLEFDKTARYSHSNANMCYSSKRGENDPRSESENIRTTALVSTGQRAFARSLGGSTTLPHCVGDTAAPTGLGDRMPNQRGEFYILRSDRFTPIGLGLAWDLLLLPTS